MNREAEALVRLLQGATIHELPEPPVRDDYAATHDYDEAYRRWLDDLTRVALRSSEPA